MYRIEDGNETRRRNQKEGESGADEDGDEDEDEDENEEVQRELKRLDGDFDPQRDGEFSQSSSSEESGSEDEDSESDIGGATAEEVVEFPDRVADDVPAGSISSRLAVVNLDWDHIRAEDLMAVFSSFCPQGGRILHVAVYPSEFGRDRMEKEALEGPPKEIFGDRSVTRSHDSDDNDDESEREEELEEHIRKSIVTEDKGDEFNSAHLRRYQLERLRYFYAVLTCSTSQCAEAIYSAVDGTEYLSTANYFDLRFVPDDMDFSEDKPRDTCDRIPAKYRPSEFVTDALQHSRVKLTWDADDTVRKEAQKRAFSGSRADIDENDLKAYLGSESSDEDDMQPETADATTQEEGQGMPVSSVRINPSKKENERQRMREMLGLGAEPARITRKKDGAAPVGDMHITFSAGLSGSKGGSVFENEPEREETTVEKYVRKEKERKARRKERMKAARSGEDAEGDSNTATTESTKGAEKDHLGFDDPFFTAPEQDKAAAAAARKEAKRLKRAERAAEEARETAKRAELELLMVDEGSGLGTLNHFDMNDIERAEKTKARRKGRRTKLTAREKQALDAQAKDSFKMDVQDPRFNAVYERNEFAVDPSHPKFKSTEGMKALLAETRRKRAGFDKHDEEQKQKKRRAGYTPELFP